MSEIPNSTPVPPPPVATAGQPNPVPPPPVATAGQPNPEPPPPVATAGPPNPVPPPPVATAGQPNPVPPPPVATAGQPNPVPVETHQPSSVASSVPTNSTVPPSEATSGLGGPIASTVTNSQATTASTAVEPTPVAKPITEDELALAAKRKDQLQRSKAWRKSRNKCLVLSVFVFALIMGIGGIVNWALFEIEFSEPPSSYSEDSFRHAILAYCTLALIAPFGFIVLASRISNMFVGMVFMMVIILGISFAMSGASRAGYSRKHDSLPELTLYYKKVYREENKVPEFYNKVQRRCECCGFDQMDRIEDWPKTLESSDFPEGCCKVERRCQGLGRMWNQARVPSGFLIIMPEDPQILNSWLANSGPEKTTGDTQPSEKYWLASKHQQQHVTESLSAQIVQQEAESLFNFHREANDAIGPQGTSFFEFSSNDLNDPVRVGVTDTKEKLRTGVNIAPSELLTRLDRTVDYSIYYNDGNGSSGSDSDIHRNRGVIFQLPVRVPTTIHANNDSLGKESFRAYYFTNGLLENIVFDQHDLIWDRRCETKLETHNFPACPNYHTVIDKNKKLSYTERLRNRIQPNHTIDGLFVGILKREMFVEALLCGGVLFFVLTLAVIFWYYYSQLKADEQANLTVPTDFSLIKHDLEAGEDDEHDRAKQKELLKMRQRERRERVDKEVSQGYRRTAHDILEHHHHHRNHKSDHHKDHPNVHNPPTGSVRSFFQRNRVAPSTASYFPPSASSSVVSHFGPTASRSQFGAPGLSFANLSRAPGQSLMSIAPTGSKSHQRLEKAKPGPAKK